VFASTQGYVESHPRQWEKGSSFPGMCLICPAITTDGCDPDFDDPRFQNRVLYDVSEKKLKGLKKIYREYSLPDLLKNESKRRSFFRLLALK